MKVFDAAPSSSSLLKGGGQKRVVDDLPIEYGEDRIVLMPVNPSLCFVYWEVALSRFKDRSMFVRLVDAEDDVIYEFEIRDRVGDYYINRYLPDRKVFAIMGIKNAKDFVEILRSNSVILPRDYAEVKDESGIWGELIDEADKALGFSSLLTRRDELLKQLQESVFEEKHDE